MSWAVASPSPLADNGSPSPAPATDVAVVVDAPVVAGALLVVTVADVLGVVGVLVAGRRFLVVLVEVAEPRRVEVVDV